MKDKELELSNLQQETAVNYLSFINSVFKRANSENELKKRVEELLLDFLNDDMNVKNLTLGGMTNLFNAVSKSDNDFLVGLTSVIAKSNSKSENPPFMPPPASNEKHIGEGGQGNNPSPEDIKQAKRILDLLENVKKLGESEK